jgi:hypothetical protein
VAAVRARKGIYGASLFREHEERRVSHQATNPALAWCWKQFSQAAVDALQRRSRLAKDLISRRETVSSDLQEKNVVAVLRDDGEWYSVVDAS